MKEELAEALLGKIMGWSKDDLAKERFRNQMMAELKYDDYQQYSQGMKYIESLALWLNAFDYEDRSLLYDFIKYNLVFISEMQMRQLIDMAYQFYIRPILINDMKTICKELEIKNLSERKNIYKCLQRQSLFLGLSDGAHIDVFRRDHPFLNNEQINVYYDFSKEKVIDIKKELAEAIKLLPATPVSSTEFKYIFLLDDFSASGISFIRKENNEWKGKITKFLNQLKDYEFDYERINIYILLYLATEDSIEYINKELELFKSEMGLANELKALAVQLIWRKDPDQHMIKLLDKYYKKYKMEEIQDRHYSKGKCDNPYLGFNECSLPLVIYHNTPNNSFPIIWFDKRYIFKGLFPRVTRHKEDS